MRRINLLRSLNIHRLYGALFGVTWLVAAASSSHAEVTLEDLHRGDPAPVFAMQTVSGDTFDLEKMKGRTTILVFGETNHDRCLEAWQDIGTLLAGQEFERKTISWAMVLSKSSDPNALDLGRVPGVRPSVIHDHGRSLFGAYGIIVTPTAVVIGGDGRVVHVATGLSLRFSDGMQDAIRLALGTITAEQFDALMHPRSSLQPTESQRKSERLVKLADHLLSRGMTELAEQKYLEAVATDSSCFDARIGTGMMFLGAERFADAEDHFRRAVELKPSSKEAATCLAQSIALSGNDRLEEAERIVRNVIEGDETFARAHYVLGLVFEQRDEIELAADEFKRCSSLLLKAQEAATRDHSTFTVQDSN